MTREEFTMLAAVNSHRMSRGDLQGWLEAECMTAPFDADDVLSDIDKASVPDSMISFYAAECMEFPDAGQITETDTLEEAIALYEDIPARRMSGVKGVGFVLHDGSLYDGLRYSLIDGTGLTDLSDIRHYMECKPVMTAWDKCRMYLKSK